MSIISSEVKMSGITIGAIAGIVLYQVVKAAIKRVAR